MLIWTATPGHYHDYVNMDIIVCIYDLIRHMRE